MAVDYDACEMQAMRFVETADSTDLWIASGVSAITGVLLAFFAFPALHPDFWGAASIAVGARPPEAPVMGLWTFFAGHLCRFFGQSTGLAILTVLGRVTGAVFAGVAYLLIRSIFALRINLPAPEMARCSLGMRLFAAVGALAFVCSDSMWRAMQFFSNDLLHLFLAALSLGSFLMFRRRGKLSWFCLCYVFAGLLAAETPVGAIFALSFFTVNLMMKYRSLKSPTVIHAYDTKAIQARLRAKGDETTVIFDDERADDPEEFFDDEVATEVDLEATSLENWAFCVFFFTALFAALFLDAWSYRMMGGMVVKNIGNWDYPVVLFVSWIGQLQKMITIDDFLAASAFTLVPCVISYILMPKATDPKDRFSFPISWLIFFLGIAAWTQLGPFSRFWYWSWDLSRSQMPSGTVQTVLAFFGAGTLVAAMQVVYCGCRSRMKGIDTIAVVELRAHANLRRFGKAVLIFMTILALAGSFLGRRQEHICRGISLVWDYVRMTADHVRGMRWLFTDGSYDDAVTLELNARGEKVPFPVSVMSGHAPYETFLRVRTMMDEEDKPMLEASGAEALRFWVGTKHNHLRASAVQVGFEALRKCRSELPIPAGMALRIARSSEETNAFVRANVDVRAFSDRVLAFVRENTSAISGFDRSLNEKMDFMLWRLARLADQRLVVAARKEDGEAISDNRELAETLDKANVSLRLLTSKLERLKPSEGLVLTPKEGLEISLKRADFDLAHKYARQVLRVESDNLNANFALGMWSLEAQAYSKAIRFLELALQKRPNEPVILNNIALAKLHNGDIPGAMKSIEAAKGINSTSKEILRNYKEISTAFAKYEEELRKKNEKKDEEPGSQIIPYFENSALPNLDESDE